MPTAFEPDIKSLHFWRERILKVLLGVGLMVALFAFIPMIVMAVREELWIILFLNSAVYAGGVFVLFSKRISYGLRATMALALTYAMGLYIVGLFGLLSGGPFCLFAFAVLASLLLGLRAAAVAIAVNAFTLLVFGWLAVHGLWAQDLPFYPTTMRALVALATFLLMNAVSAFAAAAMVRGMQHLAEKEQAANLDLRREHVKLTQEVEERKKAETALRESEHRYRILADNVTDIIWTYNLEEAKFSYVSPSVVAMRGYPIEEVMAQKMEDILAPESFELATSVIAEELARDGEPGVDPKRSRTLEVQEIRSDGSYFWAEATTTILRDKAGNPVGLTGITRDISERKEAEAEKARLEQRIQEGQKMEAIGTLTGGVAHDFNNILGVILGYVDLMLFDSNKASQNHSNLVEMKKAGLRAREIVSQLLRFSRKAGQVLEPVEIAPLVLDSLKLLRSMIPSSVVIKEHVPRSKDVIMADATHIHQVMMNLCLNAFQAMEESGGTLEVWLKNAYMHQDHALLSPDLDEGEFVHIIVRDTGPGIDPAIIDRIFDPYFTTKEVGQGSGLGLAVVHGIVRNHGGNISVESAQGEGCVFHVVFPVVEEKANEQRKEPQNLPRGKESILLVDDEDTMVDMTSHMLTRLGYSVTSCTSPAKGLEYLQAQNPAFDLVITDMTMPEMSGTSFFEEIRKISPHMPVVLATGHSSLIDEKKALSMGITAYLEKPVPMHLMAKTLREILDGEEKSA